MALVLASLFMRPASALPRSLRVRASSLNVRRDRVHLAPAQERGLLVTARAIRAGDLLHLTRAASPQFVRPIVVRVIRELADRHTYHGWTWVEAYELDARGVAVAKRELFVLRAGLRWLTPGPPAPTTRRPVPGACGVRVPA
ncbi:hypothetical protein ACH4OY_07560 [Micromonospora rubida]|uniref:Uncharacterized protein n=1 Tax=Micromonospora rubida TaxID=2697657 RepID=A0ABW7SFT6_9ACTN